MNQTSWNRNSIEKTGKRYDLLLLFVAILSIISLVINKPIIFFVVGFIGFYVLLIRIVDKRIGKKLLLDNKQHSIRLFEGDKGYLEFNLTNYSLLPFLNASMDFNTNQNVFSESYVRDSRMRMNQYKIPFILQGKSEAHFSIPIEGMKRGVTHVENIKINFPHLLNFEQLELPLLGEYHTEILIYPKLIPVAGLEEFAFNNFGNQVTPFSPFEDQLSPVGTRAYVQSDPFHRIHWKASAKNQTLQTKIYERNQKMAWTIIVNIAEISPVGNTYRSDKMEAILSQAAYICQMITKKNYPLKMYVNASRIGNVPFFIGEGNGNNHLKKMLELLARIGDDNNAIPLADVMHRVDRGMEVSDRLILVGSLDQKSLSYTNKWNKQGNSTFQVMDSENGAYLSERVFEYEAK